MGGAVRIILIVLGLVVAAAVAGYFLTPPVASRSQTLNVEAPASTVIARLATTPVGTTVTEGVVVAEAASVEGDTITAPVTYADGATGRVVYTVTPDGEGSRVQVKLEQDLGANPLDRFAVLTGGDVAPLIEPAAAAVTADLGALPQASFEGLQYEIVDIAARPFFYVENCSDASAESITSIIAQAVAAIPPVMRQNGLTPNGPLMAVEPRVVEGQYCYQVGYPYAGRQPRALLIGRTGQTPSGQALRITYTGAEADVLDQIYNPMDALLAAAHVDNPGTTEDDWTTYEVYNDDATQEGGSRNRQIYYVVQGDISAVTRLLAPTDPATAAPAAAEAAPAGETPAEATEPEAAPATP